MMQTQDSDTRNSLREYGRGIAGGVLFSIPMLYTMEMWEFGFVLSHSAFLIYAVATYVLLLGYNRYAGLHRDATWWEVAIDSVEEMGLGIALSATILVMLGRITSDMALSEAVGKIVMTGMTVAIGVSVGSAQLGGSTAEQGPEDNSGERPSRFHEQLVIAFIAAILVAGNIAPTEEIVILGMYLGPWNLAALAVLSLLLNALILFYADFVGSERHLPETLTIHNAAGMSAASYAVALSATALMLWFFGRFEGASSMQMLSATISLGLVSTLGASAGRLLLQ